MIKNLSKNWKNILLYAVLLALIFGSVFYLSSRQNTKETQYSTIVSYFRDNKVSEFELDLSSGSLKYHLKGKNNKEELVYTVPSPTIFLDDVSDYVKDYNNSNPKEPIIYNYQRGSSGSMWLSILPTLILVVVIGGFGLYMVKKMSGAINSDTNKTLGFGKARTKILVDDEKRKTTFADVAGCEEEKQELAELVDFLKEPEKFNKLGARIPKGVLLVGPPGTGKTLLARAVAGEAGAPFLSISGSDFVEMYVGVGASRVRDLFAQAKKQSPAIIFIDEIDAVGRHRGAGMGGGNDEREQTLNQLLVEMDGFGANEGVIIIAATNRPDVLDPALLRPGRFDRQVTVGLPDTKGREDILKVHSKNKPLGPDVNLKDIAKSTIGFSGADLENVLNEAALFAARNNRKAIINQDIQNATLKVVMGSEKKSHKFTDKAKRLTAVHEAGHAIASYFTPDTDPVKEISIIPRSKGAGGYTMYIPQDEDFNYNSKATMLGELVSLVGGRVAEAVVLKDISTGASNDLQRASSIARDMVTKYGMSEKIGPVAFNEDNDEVFLGMDYGHVKSYSEETSAIIDSEVSRIVNEAYAKCMEIIKEHVDALNKVAEILVDKEKISGEDFVSIVEKGYIEEVAEDDSVAESVDNSDSTVEENSAENKEFNAVDDKSIDDDSNEQNS